MPARRDATTARDVATVLALVILAVLALRVHDEVDALGTPRVPATWRYDRLVAALTDDAGLRVPATA